MPSFSFEDVQKLTVFFRQKIPVIRGKVWSSDDRVQGWTIECENYTAFSELVQSIPEQIELLAYDESKLDEDSLYTLQDELHHYSQDEGISHETVTKAMSALRSHENEIFATYGYAFLKSGHVVFTRAQGELARYVFHPGRLLSSEGIFNIRKLKTLEDTNKTIQPIQ